MLDELRVTSPQPAAELGALYDRLAEAAAESDDFELAVRAQRRAVELGCEYPELARQMLAWYLLKSGSKQEGEAAFAELRAERDNDPEVLLVLAEARMDSGDSRGALEAFDVALASAREREDEDWAREIRGDRRFARTKLGLEPDDDDVLSNPPPDNWLPDRAIVARLVSSRSDCGGAFALASSARRPPRPGRLMPGDRG